MSEFLEPAATIDEAHAFMADLRETQKRDGLWLAYSPFSRRVATGEATREEIGEWCKQFFLALTHFHRGAHSRPRARLNGLKPEFKKHFWENRVEEEYGALSNTAGHVELLLRLAETLGVSRLDMVTAKPNAATRAVMDRASRTLPDPDDFLPGSVVTGALEAMNPEASTAISQGLMKHYGIGEREAQFFTVHIYADAEHAEVGAQLLTLVAKQKWPAIKEQALEASRGFYAMWTSVTPHAKAA
ncbi:MAG: iron-containing redox enzyme family protein [Stellaceae bacterium]